MSGARPSGRTFEVVPGTRWRWARRSIQTLAWIAVLFGPLIGGWQRLEFTREQATWFDVGWGLPLPVQQLLPVPSPPDALSGANALMGAGIAAEWFGIPFVDPLAGGLALFGGALSARSVAALVIPVVLAVVAGRVFCGWFCVFGSLSRAIEALCARLPFYRFRALPERRWLRWGVLSVAVLASLTGSHVALYLLLPYLLVSQSVYAAWLLGGGGAILGVLAGLLFAGLVFGPTLYCSAVCPTGSALSLLGRRRAVRLAQLEPAACGTHCDLCDRACWLQLKPGSGDPGPDCDLCARCVNACPRTNLVIAPTLRIASRAAVVALVVGATLGAPSAHARDERKPALVFDAEVALGDVTVAASAIDFTGFRLDADWSVARDAVELSIFIARGRPELPAAIDTRDSYRGPLGVSVLRATGEGPERVEFGEPNSPISAQHRRIYRAELREPLLPGDRIRFDPIPGWIAELTLEVPARGSRARTPEVLRYFAASALAFSGLLSLALVGRSGRKD